VTANQNIYDTYYSVLEKAQALEGALTTLGELGELWRSANDSFDRDAANLDNEVRQQLDSLGNFDAQRRRIEALQSRIRNGRSRLMELGGRVQAVRQKVEGWERKDAEWRERTRRRLKAIWILLLVIGLAVVLLTIGAQYYGSGGSSMQTRAGLREQREAAANRTLRMLDDL